MLTYPNDDDAITYLFALIVERYGFSWLEELIKQDVKWVRGTTTPTILIADAHNQTSTSALTFTTFGFRNAPNFIVSREPEAPEQYMSWTQTAAIFAGSTRPESAKLFVAWLLSDEVQRPIVEQGTAVVRKSLDEGKLYGSNGTQVEGFRVFMNDRKVVDWWKLQFETSLGTAQGVSPLEIY